MRRQKQVLAHTRLSRAYLALARLSCLLLFAFARINDTFNVDFCEIWL